jgi:hypothetical protein
MPPPVHTILQVHKELLGAYYAQKFNVDFR